MNTTNFFEKDFYFFWKFYYFLLIITKSYQIEPYYHEFIQIHRLEYLKKNAHFRGLLFRVLGHNLQFDLSNWIPGKRLSTF